jgi:type I restriction enzyme S subunit
MKNHQLSIDRYEAYQDSGIEWLGEVPSHWKVVRAKDICQIFVPQRDKPDLNEEKGTPWITSDLLENTKIDSEKLKYLVDEGEIKYKKIRKVCPNSVLASCIGEFSLTAINQFAVVTNQQIQAYSYIKEQSSEFINYQIQANVTRVYYETVATETTIKYINKEKFSFTPLYLPPLPEQETIARYLDTKTAQIDRKIDLLTQKATLYGDLKRSLINETVTRGLDKSVPMKDSDYEWDQKIPTSWQETRVKNIFKLVTDLAPDNNDFELLSLYTSIGVKPRKDMEQRGNKSVTTDGYWMVKKGDIIVNKLLAWMGAIGLSDYDGVTSPAYDILRKSSDKVDQRFYTYLFRTEKAQAIFKKQSRGIMDVRLRLYFDKFGVILVPFPSPEEQKAIADYLDTKTVQIDQIIQTINTQIERLKELRKTLINDVVTGKIKVIDNG